MYYKVKFLKSAKYTEEELKSMMGSQIPVYDAITNELIRYEEFSQEDYDKKMDEVIDSFSAENATLDTVAATVVDVVNDIITDLNNSEDESLHLLEGVNEEILTEAIKGKLDTFADEEGNIDIEAALTELFNNAFTVVSDSNSDSASVATRSGMALLTAKAEETPETEETATLAQTALH